MMHSGMCLIIELSVRGWPRDVLHGIMRRKWLVFQYLKAYFEISLCILRDLPQQKIGRELCDGGESRYTSMLLWKDILIGRIRKIQIYIFLQQTRNSTKADLSSGRPPLHLLLINPDKLSCYLLTCKTYHNYRPENCIPRIDSPTSLSFNTK